MSAVIGILILKSAIKRHMADFRSMRLQKMKRVAKL